MEKDKRTYDTSNWVTTRTEPYRFGEKEETIFDWLKQTNEIKFEIVESFKNIIDERFIPRRSTNGSAGYDIMAATDIVVPSIFKLNYNLNNYDDVIETEFGSEPYSLDQIDSIIKSYSDRLTLIPTGLKAKFPKHIKLCIYSRSSMPYKHFLIVGNSVAVIDSDYYNNPDNEGHISVMLINLSAYDIMIKKGDKIAQFIFEPIVGVTEEDNVNNHRKGGYGSTGK